MSPESYDQLQREQKRQRSSNRRIGLAALVTGAVLILLAVMDPAFTAGMALVLIIGGFVGIKANVSSPKPREKTEEGEDFDDAGRKARAYFAAAEEHPAPHVNPCTQCGCGELDSGHSEEVG